MSIISRKVFQMMFGRRDKNSQKNKPGSRSVWLIGPDYERYLRSKREEQPVFRQYPFEEWSVTGADGLRLFARFCRSGDSEKTAVLIHGHQSDGIRGYCDIGQRYLRKGWNILIPDNRACGKSCGDWTTFGILESRDTLLWLAELNRRYPGQAVILHGTSLGGATVCTMSGMKLPDNIYAIVSDCAFSDMKAELAHMLRAYARIPCPLLLSGLEREFRRNTGYLFQDSTVLKSVANATVPMLFIHGKEDRYVPVAHCDALYSSCSSPVRMRLIVDGAGHSASALLNPDLYNKTLFDFLDRCLPGIQQK